MSPIDERTDIGRGTPARRMRAFADAFAAGLRRLARPVRPEAAPPFRVFETWAARTAALVAGIALVAAGMAYVDPLIQPWPRQFGGATAALFQILTDVGKSGWVLIPSGVGILAILAAVPPARAFADRVVLALAARLAFVFIAVGGSGLIVTTVKRIIGRGRPHYFDQHGSLHFDVMAWKASYASFPSGHSQTAFAIAVSFACLFPRWRTPLVIAATVVAFSRIMVDAHYLTDVIVGSAWGAWFTILTREWFARRALVFSPDAGRRPFPMPWRRVRGALARLGARLRGG